MKTKLLAFTFCLFSLTSFSQTNGWYQYHKGTQITDITTDASGNIHLVTDGGYMMYNTTTNIVEDYANLTSQSQPIGWCTAVRVNPINNNVALGFPSGQGIAIYDGANYIIYHSGNSDIGNFSSPELHYTDGGLLYIYDKTDTKYQTFENGVFEAVQDLTFRPQAIIENLASNLVYFAGLTPGGLSDGLYELDKTTDIFTKYTTSNSGIHTNGPTCFYRDTNDLLYIGGYGGVSTLDDMGNWATYQEPLPINPSVFYNVFSIDKFNDGTFLVNNSNPNSSEERGFSTVDFTTNTWTHYDSSVYCNASDQVQNIVLSNDMIYTHFRKFSNPSEDYKLWSFDPATNICEEKDINHLNVTSLGNFGTTGLAIRESQTSINNIQLLWTNNGGNNLNSLELPINSNFSDGFPETTTPLNIATNSLNIVSPIKIIDEPILIVGEDNGVFFISSDNESTYVPLLLDDFRAISLQVGFSSDNGEKSFGVLGGWNDDTFEYETRIIEMFGTVDVGTGNINDTSVRLSEPIDYGSVLFSGIIDIITSKDENGNLNFTASGQTNSGENHIVNLSYTPEDNTNSILSPPSISYTDNIDEFVDFTPDVFYANFEENEQSSPCFQGTNNTIYCSEIDPNTSEVVYQEYEVDANNNGENDQIQKVGGFSSNLDDDPEEYDFVKALFEILQSEGIGKEFSYLIAARESSGFGSRNTTIALDTEIVPETTIENLPEDFYILDSFVYIYNDTDYATVLSTTYGLLINTAIDYSSLVLDVHEIEPNHNTKIYPNPTKDLVNINDMTIDKVDIYDINGRLVLSTDKTVFSIKHLVNGIYFIEATNINGRAMSRKLIKN